MFYSAKNAKIILDNNNIYANNVLISTQASISPNFLQEEVAPSYYVPENGIAGSLKINYFITGKDFLKDYINDTSRYISGNFGGLNFLSGCIRSYSLEGQPNQPISVNAELLFYEQLNGEFTPSYEKLPPVELLNFSNVTLNGTSLGELSNVKKISFESNIEINPVYLDNQSITPSYIHFGKKQTSFNIVYDNLSGDLPISGKNCSATVTLNNYQGVTREGFGINGTIYRKEIGFDNNQSIDMILSIIQDSIIPEPVITGFQPLSGFGQHNVIILGTGFGSVTQAYQGDKIIPIVKMFNDNKIGVRVQKSPISGRLKLVAQGGIAISPLFYLIISEPMGRF